MACELGVNSKKTPNYQKSIYKTKDVLQDEDTSLYMSLSPCLPIGKISYNAKRSSRLGHEC